MSNPKLQKIIKLTQTQYDILSNGGTVGGYTGLNDNYLYLIQDDTNYQPLDGDLTAIAALSGTGYLKRTGNNVWTLDNSTFATQTWVTNQGYITGITSAMVTTALGYTPYNSSNPAGYITTAALSGYATQQWVTSQGYLTSVSWNDVQNKPNFATVATSGDYDDLTNKPSIPSVYDTTVSFYNVNDGTFMGSFSRNDSTNTSLNFNIPLKATDVNQYGNYYTSPTQIRQYQQTFGVAPDLLHNINGHDLSGTYGILNVTVGGYPAVKVLKNDLKLSFDESHNYMRKITGSEYTPIYGDGTVPQFSYIIDGNGKVYKAQWDSTNGLLLYIVAQLALHSEIPDAVSGTNDGTNWTTITIGNETYNIPTGGSGGAVNDVTVNGTSVVSSGIAAIIFPHLNSGNTRMTSSSTVYAPTSGATVGNVLVSNGTGSNEPLWKDPILGLTSAWPTAGSSASTACAQIGRLLICVGYKPYSSSSMTCNFYRSFSSTPFVMCQAVYNSAGSVYGNRFYPSSVTTTGFTPAASASGVGVCYIAIGYRSTLQS